MAKEKSRRTIDWLQALKPLFKKYSGRKHPLQHQNCYQLTVMVILSARDSDRNINALAPALFQKYPSIKALAAAKPEDLYPFIGKITNFVNKAAWLVTLAKTVKDDKSIPTTMERLIALPGIGRKSANVIISESGGEMEGVIVDLHVLRVVPRLGIAIGTTPEKIEKQLMETIPQKYWRELGMSLTFLGREICRPTNPHCPECPMNPVCEYYGKQK
ncbi:MAG: endonuclease III [Ignavibacteriae bacterium]|nr:endonuclease III [Ignavibacteria bacterium]MBI3363866.1 endonuclease III [Ignavibacteriota bacterium]